MKIYFDGKYTFDQYEAANKEYKRLAKQMHPDAGGNASEFQELGRQWRAWKKGHETQKERQNVNTADGFAGFSYDYVPDSDWTDVAESWRRAQESVFRNMFYGRYTSGNYQTSYTQTPKPEPEPEQPKRPDYQQRAKIKNALFLAADYGCTISLNEDGKTYCALAMKDLDGKQQAAMRHAGWKVIHKTVWEMEKNPE